MDIDVELERAASSTKVVGSIPIGMQALIKLHECKSQLVLLRCRVV